MIVLAMEIRTFFVFNVIEKLSHRVIQLKVNSVLVILLFSKFFLKKSPKLERDHFIELFYRL